MMVRAFIFDYGGVFTIQPGRPVYVQISRVFGVSLEEARKKSRKHVHALQKGEITETEFWKLFLNSFGLKPRGSLDFVFGNYSDYLEPNKRMVKIVKGLKKRGYITALISNTIEPHAEFNKSRGNYDLFSPLILSCEVGMRKPEPGIFELALKKIGKPPGECVFIDDEPENLGPAKELGMKAIHFKSQGQLIKELSALGIEI